MKPIRWALAALLLLATPGIAAAHGDDHPRHGGQMVDAPPYHLELVVDGAQLTLHVMDEEMEPVDVAGATAVATILVGGKPQRIEMAPGGASSLTGAAEEPLPPGTRVVTALTLAGQKPVQARFEVRK